MSQQERIRCCFCPREYDLIRVMYGGRAIWVCPPCGERCIESDDESGGDQDDVVGGDEDSDQESTTTTGGEQSDEDS